MEAPLRNWQENNAGRKRKHIESCPRDCLDMIVLSDSLADLDLPWSNLTHLERMTLGLLNPQLILRRPKDLWGWDYDRLMTHARQYLTKGSRREFR